MAAAQSEARLAVVKVRTRLAFEARTFDGLHVAAVAPGKQTKRPYFSCSFNILFARRISVFKKVVIFKFCLEDNKEGSLLI